MYNSTFDPNTYTQICRAALSDNPVQNSTFRINAQNLLNSPNDIIFPLTILEDHFVGACICYNRLRNRSEEYRSIIDNYSPGFIMSNPLIKELHAYEYFFFSCCGYIYKELNHEIKNCNLKMSPSLLEELRTLKEERRVREHGKDWYWGEAGKVVPTKGDNYDFERNMQLLDNIYKEVVKQLGL